MPLPARSVRGLLGLPRRRGGRRLRAGLGSSALAVGVVLGLALGLGTAPAGAASRTAAEHARAGARSVAESEGRLYLVALDGRGLAARAGLRTASTEERGAARRRLEARQERTLEAVGAPEPVYRWTSALNGYAVRLGEAQAQALREVPGVARVERNTVRPVAGSPGGAGRPGPPVPRSRGGEGVVVGVIDSGLYPDSPAFAPLGSGGRPASFRGECVGGPGWPASRCSSKIVGARWFVDGFGRERLRSSARLSVADELGHGTQVASVVSGNAGVGVRIRGEEKGRYRGVAPQSRLAVYKACWAAPDPAGDGCATADLVTAVDRAVQDRVDVLTLPVNGPASSAVLREAVLGAAEADVAAVAAAGTGGADSRPARAAPWVTTVGTALGPLPAGSLEVRGGPTLPGAMLARRDVGPARIVRGADAAAAGTPRRAAALCRPGSLDAARVDGSVVVCQRGKIGRVEKSAAVARADGVGMVLTQRGNAEPTTDFHRVPTVHLEARESATLRDWLASHPTTRAVLRPSARDLERRRLAPATPTGDAGAGPATPDLVAPGTGVLGAVPPGPTGTRWDFFSGSSAATATTAGVVAALRAAHPRWSAARVRSAVATSAAPLRGAEVLRQGSGVLRPRAARRPGLVLDQPADGWRRGWGRAGQHHLDHAARPGAAYARRHARGQSAPSTSPRVRSASTAPT